MYETLLNLITWSSWVFQCTSADVYMCSSVCVHFLERLYTSLVVRHTELSPELVEEGLIRTCAGATGKENRLVRTAPKQAHFIIFCSLLAWSVFGDRFLQNSTNKHCSIIHRWNIERSLLGLVIQTSINILYLSVIILCVS